MEGSAHCGQKRCVHCAAGEKIQRFQMICIDKVVGGDDVGDEHL